MQYMKRELKKYAKGLGARENVIKLIDRIYGNQDQGEFEHIIDYLIYKDFDDLAWASYELLNSKARKWAKQLARNVQRIDEEEGVDFKTVLDFEDGYRFVRLISEKSYQREGALMAHCVSFYFGKNKKIYSLRDTFNKPHCTIEKDVQIKGKGNGSISPKYINYVVEFLEYMGMQVREEEIKNLGYYKPGLLKYFKNKHNLFRGLYLHESVKVDYRDDVFVFTDLKSAVAYRGEKTVVLDGDADFARSKITDLGNLESIGGNAYFRNSQITNLGNLESIGGYVSFRNSQVAGLGNLESIGGYAYFGFSKITDLGNLESIGGDADFIDSQVTDLGNLESIGGNVNFRDSKITDLGGLKSIGGTAYLAHSQITDLGNLKSIGGNADFGRSQITNLGNLESIGGNAYLAHSQITDLGNLKSIDGNADFTDSQITDLGNLKSIGGNAYFAYSQVTNLGNLKSIGGYADFRRSQITDLGNLKSIGGNAYLENSRLNKEDFDNVKVLGSLIG